VKLKAHLNGNGNGIEHGGSTRGKLQRLLLEHEANAQALRTALALLDAVDRSKAVRRNGDVLAAAIEHEQQRRTEAAPASRFELPKNLRVRKGHRRLVADIHEAARLALEYHGGSMPRYEFGAAIGYDASKLPQNVIQNLVKQGVIKTTKKGHAVTVHLNERQ
jgi:hypothetical protein